MFKANDVCQSAYDGGQLKPQVIQVEETLGGLPKKTAWSFDAGYFEGANMKDLTDRKIDSYIPDNIKKKKVDSYDKKHDVSRDECRCPENQPVGFLGEHFDKQKGKVIRVYKGESCMSCPVRSNCTKRKDGIRYLKRYPCENEGNAMLAKMKTPETKEIYKLRQQIVKPAIGDIKRIRDCEHFLPEAFREQR